jgi:hypothetical protein
MSPLLDPANLKDNSCAKHYTSDITAPEAEKLRTDVQSFGTPLRSSQECKDAQNSTQSEFSHFTFHTSITETRALCGCPRACFPLLCSFPQSHRVLSFSKRAAATTTGHALQQPSNAAFQEH